MTQTIAIIAWGAMADVLYATPIVRHIRELHPDDKITWIVRDKFAEVVELNPHVDEVLKWTLPEGFNSRQDAEHVMDAAILAHAKANFDKFYDLQYWPRYSNFFERPNEDFISLRARNAGLEPSAIKDRSIVSELSQKDIDTARDFLGRNDIRSKPLVTVNHISYAASPVCNFEYYQQLTDLLKKDGISVVFTGATNEPIPEGGIDARGTSYRVWQALIGMSDFYVGLDSGAKTLACATEVPMAILHSRDFPLKKTGCASMGIRCSDIMELTTIPSVTSLADIITSYIPPWTR
jgi:ADP-heptose:LPS heptosyltransferase